MVQYTNEGLPGKDFDPTVHEFRVNEANKLSLLCDACRKLTNHHFHTGVFGSACGCEDCMSIDTWNETRMLGKASRRSFFSRIFNR